MYVHQENALDREKFASVALPAVQTGLNLLGAFFWSKFDMASQESQKVENRHS